jgi:hypothetical protein
VACAVPIDRPLGCFGGCQLQLLQLLQLRLLLLMLHLLILGQQQRGPRLGRRLVILPPFSVLMSAEARSPLRRAR